MSALATPTRIVGVVIVVFGAWLLWQAVGLREGPGYAAVGPKTFPIIVGVGIILSGLGIVLARSNTTDSAESVVDGGGTAVSDDAPERHDWRTLALFATLLALYIAFFLPLGFVACATLLFVAGAWVLGSRSWIRDFAAGVSVSLVTYVVFTALLGLDLPTGPLEQPLHLLRSMASVR